MEHRTFYKDSRLRIILINYAVCWMLAVLNNIAWQQLMLYLLTAGVGACWEVEWVGSSGAVGSG